MAFAVQVPWTGESRFAGNPFSRRLDTPPRKRPRHTHLKQEARASIPPDQTRREFMLQTAPLALSPLLLSDSGGIHTELSAIASKIPGFGQPDVYYPHFFEGDWLVSRELYAVQTEDGEADIAGHAMLSKRALASMRERIGIRESFHAHFVEHRGKVIEDRLFNTRAENAWRGNGVDVLWDRDNPNVMSVSWGGGSGTVIREVKVTKRAFVDGPQGYGTFVASEYARGVDVVGKGSLASMGRPPSVYGRRRIVRYKVSSVTDNLQPDGMDRIVVEYIYAPGRADVKAAVLLKYRDFLNRSKGSQLLGY